MSNNWDDSNFRNNPNDKRVYSCMEIAGAESIPELHYNAPIVSRDEDEEKRRYAAMHNCTNY